ncbi:MAG: ABC transporter ATP-binding protein, partial [Candidatus Hodarchaeales archaeon]
VLAGVIYLGLYILNGILTYFRIYWLGIIGNQAIYQLRQDSYEKLQEQSMDYFDDTPTGRVISTLTSDLDQLRALLSVEVLSTIISLLMIFVMLVIMLSVSPLLTMVSLVTIPLIILSSYFRRNIERPRWKDFRKVNAKLTAAMAEYITGARISLSFVRRKENIDEFEKINQSFFEAEMRAIKATSILVSLLEIFSSLSTALVLVAGSILLFYGYNNITPGNLVLFISYQAMFFQPVNRVAGIYGRLQTAFASLERVITLHDRKPEIQEIPGAPSLIVKEGKIEFRNVSFSYKEDEPILSDFSLIIEPKKCLAIVGETGSGKTTFVRLLSRFYEVDSGEILIDGQDISKVSLESLRKNIGIVLQEPFLYSETIRYNLTYGNDSISDEELHHYISLIGCDFIYELPDRLNTIVGERGSRLSLGQRQLVSFVRAIITNPKILVLDEATSSVDPNIELKIQKALKELFKDRTSIVIAHRLSTIREADKIVVLDMGKIVEIGTFEELLEKKGRFYAYYRLQTET